MKQNRANETLLTISDAYITSLQLWVEKGSIKLSEKNCIDAFAWATPVLSESVKSTKDDGLE